MDAPSKIARRFLGIYVGGAVIALILFFLLVPFTIVGPGSRGVLMNFSAVQPGVLAPGIHFVVPFVQSVEQMDVRVHKWEGDEEASSLDLQDVHTKVAVNFHLSPSDAGWIFQNVGTLDRVIQVAIEPSVQNAVKAVTAHFNAEDLVAKRDHVALETSRLLTTALTPYHVIVDAVNITNFTFSPQFSAAIEAKQVAQQQALQANYELDKRRIAAQQGIVQADADAKAKIAAAEGDARATVLRAEATAKANDLVQRTLSSQVLRLKALEKWSGEVPRVVGAGNPLPFLTLGAADSSKAGDLSGN